MQVELAFWLIARCTIQENCVTSLAKRIDDLCDLYEHQWTPESPLTLVSFLRAQPDTDGAQLLEALIELDIELRLQHGLPCSVDLYEELGKQAREFADRELSRLEKTVLGDSEGAAGAPSEATTTVGPFHIIRCIGEGGMGKVYLAEQTEPIRRLVALKLIITDTPTREILSRFEAERQALAVMNHPNIARVIDAGIAESGRPYFAMEYVDGVSINEYCDANRLSPRQRLALFVQTCRAIQHAHAKGIVHRDLKPSNVLVGTVDGAPVVKVIDFGLAKVMNSSAQDGLHSLHTQLGQIMGTLAYMSPEQAGMNAAEVDTRTDVYSLGVILFELLTGSTPVTRAFIKQEALDRVLFRIREETISRPSHRLNESRQTLTDVASQRSTDARRLGSILRGDLDWIVMKALEKDPDRRYDTPAALADDVARFLDREPVEARPPSIGYRLRKAFLRNKAVFVTAGLSLAALVAALGIAVRLWANERAATADLKRARTALQKERDDAIEARTAAYRSEQAAERRRDEADDARRQAIAEQEAAEAERQVSKAVQTFLQDDIIRQGSIFEQANRGEAVSAEITVRQAVESAANKYTRSDIERLFPGRPDVQAEILGTLAEALSVLEAHDLAIRCSVDRVALLQKDATTTRTPLSPMLLSAQVEHAFLLVNARDTLGAARQYAQNLADLEAVLTFTDADLPDSSLSLNEEIDRRLEAYFETLDARLDLTRFHVDQWLSQTPGPVETVQLFTAVQPTLGQPQRILDLMQARYPDDDPRVLYSAMIVAVEQHAGCDIKENAPFGAMAFSMLQHDLSYDAAIEIYNELIARGETSLQADQPLLQDTELKVAGLHFMAGLAEHDKGDLIAKRGDKEAGLDLQESALVHFTETASFIESKLGNHPALLMPNSFRVACHKRMEQWDEAIACQQHMVDQCLQFFGTYQQVDELENFGDIYRLKAVKVDSAESLAQALATYQHALERLNDQRAKLTADAIKKFEPRIKRKIEWCKEQPAAP